MQEHLYLVLDSKGTPLANAVLESPPNAEVLQIRVLNDKVDDVAAHREIQLIGIDDSTPNRIGVIVRQREDQLVIQPTAALDSNARENLRILTDFSSVMYPVSGSWKGQKAVRAKDLSCGGVAFYTTAPLVHREIVELVLPVTDHPLVVKTQVIREVKEEGSPPLYAAKFVDLIQDEEALIRKAVFSIQIRTS
ncbi:PilZ domain-containing protein [Pseudoflavonifractor sp. 60]|uniref:PilZ domain-containing protein n=1 Tax=Pseudoflavonifractor sp. 60 TaxID=2304576 RepID=UPI00137159D0|nr:PilZ domain-containing protein [Pseudoflavonifractor sp. 60]NBI67703.1 PilZ domain-containing protein [Pseudoflavonifractor sp. 60]